MAQMPDQHQSNSRSHVWTASRASGDAPGHRLSFSLSAPWCRAYAAPRSSN